MEEIKKMLEEVMANQVVIFTQIQKMQDKVEGRVRVQQPKAYVDALKSEAEKYLPHINE